jgi:Parvulin-like peptidyl-prolyl isomerase
MGMSILSIRRYAKRLLAPVIIVLVVAMMVGVFYIGFPSMTKENTAYVGPSIKVNGQKLSDAEFNNYLMQASQQASQFAQYGMAYSDAQIRDSAISMAVQNIAFDQEMQKVKSKIKVSNSEVNDLIKKYLPTEEELQSFMERQGFDSKNQLMKAVRQDLERQKFIQYKAQQLKITVPRADIVAQLEQITVSHILIGLKDSNNKPRTDAQALQQANEVYQKVTSGGDFAQLAKQYSDDPGSKDKGGTYGPMPLDQFKTSMAKEFVDGALALKAGQISKPVKTQFGYHIIRLDAEGVPTGSEYKEKYKQVHDSLLVRKAQESPAYTDWVQKINRKAQNNLEILDPGLRAFRLKNEQKWEEASVAYEKAMKKGYYKNRLDTYIDASDVYVQLKQVQKAIALLKKAPVALITDSIDYQIAMANAYKADNKLNQAEAILGKYGAEHADDVNVHNKLKEIYTSWNLNDLAAGETQKIADIQKQEQEKAKQYQESLNQKQSGTVGTGTENVKPAVSQPTPVKK